MEEITSQVHGRKILNKFQGTPKQQQPDHHQLKMMMKKKKKKKKMMNLHQRQPSSLILLNNRSRNNSRNNKSSTKFDQRKLEGCKDEEISDVDDEKDNKVMGGGMDIERRIMALQKLVPAGGSDDERSIDKLFEETADYILALQGQVNTLKFLTSFFQEGSLDQHHQIKEKRKSGG